MGEAVCTCVHQVSLSISVTGYSGGGVNITCRYDRKYKKKYFCRREWLTCFELIRTETKDKWVDSGRFSLFDDTRAAVFTVTFRDLSEQDSGTYWCGVDISLSEDPYTEVNLNVVTGESVFDLVELLYLNDITLTFVWLLQLSVFEHIRCDKKKK
uniref:Ig-like domain-containing protein n=1 Tax=Cyprinus carpio TaxID=7962 RepID=A0A8C2Q084_CYPCA